ncbi:tetratricopeptide repeat protein [Skeletonema marinoi]|uniref:Tetratricopeptide repeat protein n=1 Tax=Skeletonema marinoi TaxID=267567 RepID=A0AAD9D5F4_9STRA|nr:tetratricopeptide repeat protein [Skeletonema marinoi]
MEYSTVEVEAFATGLLCDNVKDGYVCDSLIKLVDSSHMTIKYRYSPLEVNETMKHRLAKSVSALLQNRDADGKTLLHYITAYNVVQTNNLDEPGKMMLILHSVKEKYIEEGRTFPFNYFSWDSFNGDETLGNEMFILEKNRRRQTQEKVGEIARWILKKEPTLTESVDNEGLNPFHFQYAVSVGKKWSEGLDVVAGLVPGWTQAHGKVGLSPFAIAGYACDDIDTLFELLRFDSSVLSGYDVDGDTAKRDEDSSEVKDDESVKQMINEVLRPLAAIIEANDPVAIRQKGSEYFGQGDYGAAVELFKKAAKLGDGEANYQLAGCYGLGLGVERKPKMEIFYWEEAAIGGHPKARYNIGVTEKRNGRFDRAQRHWIIAASQGHTNSVKALVENHKRGLVKKEVADDALRAYKAAVDATKSPQREAAEAVNQNVNSYR